MKRSYSLLFLAWISTNLYATALCEKEVEVRQTIAPQIDGLLNDNCWESFDTLTGFIQKEPRQGEAATQQTQVYITYDEKKICFGFKCFEDEIDKIATAQNKRDAPVYLDDCVEIFLDTYHDHRNAYYFAVNAAGTQLDGRIVDEGRIIDSRWDANWVCVTSRDSNCWYAEIAIPFSELSFNPDTNMVWGVNFYRTEKPHQENSYWVNTGSNLFQVSQFGHLDGLSDIRNNLGFMVIPYIVPNYQEAIPKRSDAAKAFKTRIGADLQYNILSSLKLDGTINPDFAQIESDQDQFNVSFQKGEELQLQEKRPFFLEGLDVFNTPLSLLYTRRMNEIKWGGKLCGKVGPVSLAVLDVQTEDIEANYAAGRIKYDLLKRTTIGAIWINKNDTGNNFSRVYGVDANVPIGKPFRITGQYAKSDNPGFDALNNAGRIDFNYATRTLTFGAKYEDIGRDFNVAFGYIPRYKKDCLSGNVWGDYTLWINKSGIRWFNWGGTYYRSKNHDLELTRTENTVYAGILTLDKYFASIKHFESSERYGNEWYRNQTQEINLATNNGEWTGYGANIKWGWLYNARYRSETVSAYIQPLNNFTCEFSLANQLLDINKDWIITVKTNHQITRNIFLRSFIQYSTEQNVDQYNIIIGYNYLPGSDVYLVYNEKHDASLMPTQVDRVIMAKITYMWKI